MCWNSVSLLPFFRPLDLPTFLWFYVSHKFTLTLLSSPSLPLFLPTLSPAETSSSPTRTSQKMCKLPIPLFDSLGTFSWACPQESPPLLDSCLPPLHPTQTRDSPTQLTSLMSVIVIKYCFTSRLSTFGGLGSSQ